MMAEHFGYPLHSSSVDLNLPEACLVAEKEDEMVYADEMDGPLDRLYGSHHLQVMMVVTQMVAALIKLVLLVGVVVVQGCSQDLEKGGA